MGQFDNIFGGTPQKGVPTTFTKNQFGDIFADQRKKKKEEEEERKKREEEQRQSETRRKKAEETIKKKDEELKSKKVEEEVFSRKETIRQATDEEAKQSRQKTGFWESVKQFFGFKPKDETIRETLVKQQKSREDIRKKEIEQLGGGVGESIGEGLQSGLIGSASLLQSAASVAARKVKAEKLAEKLDIDARENRRLKQLFDEEYRVDIITDKYSTVEKMRSTPVRFIAGIVSEAAVSSLPPVVAGGAAIYLGAPVLAGTALSVGLGLILTFGGAYQDAREFDLSEEEAEKVGFMTALMSAPLEFIPEFIVLRKLGGGKAAQQQIARAYSRNITSEIVQRTTGAVGTFARQGALESMTEVPQTVVENAWAKTYDENREYFQGADVAFLAGFFTGGMMDTLVSMTSSVQAKVRQNTGQAPATEGVNDMSIEEIPPEQIIYQQPEEPVIAEARQVAEAVQETEERVAVPTSKEKVKEPIPVFRGESKTRTAPTGVLAEAKPVSTNRAAAEIFAGEGGAVTELFLDPDAKIITTEELTEKGIVGTVAQIEYAKEHGFDAIDKRSLKLEIQKTQDKGVRAFEDEIKVINQDVLKTKEQISGEPKEKKPVQPSVFKERLALDPDEIFKSQVIDELVAAEAGQRIFAEDATSGGQQVIGQKSTFPDWVPSDLRSRKLFDQVIDDVVSDRAPKPGTKRHELYTIVQNRINQHLELPPIDEFPGKKLRTRGLAKSVSERAVAQKVSKPFKDLPEYARLDMNEQATLARELLISDPERARRIAFGQEDPPKGMLPEIMFRTFENQALANGDAATLRDLATTSELTREDTVMGQRIAALGFGDPDSPVAAIKEVIREREKGAKKRLKGKSIASEKAKIAGDIKNSITSTISSSKKWGEFLDKLQC